MFRKQQITDTFINFFSHKTKLFYIVEPSDWSIKWDGKYITEQLNKNFNLEAKITASRFALRNKILHFGSLNTFIKYSGFVNVPKSNKIVFTWFHITDNDPRIKFIKELNSKTDFVHTSCEITKRRLVAEGLNENKIIIAPIGINLNLFKVLSEEKKKQIRKKLNLPENKIIIGSFQKDGIGWGEGNEPKMIKGPDIFCDTVEKIAAKYNIHVLLTGPARGYVKKRLMKAGISFTHRFLKNYFDIVNYYNVLDLYIISSRAEGGPKAITESMACGVPVVSTKTGMAPDIIKNGINGCLADIENIDLLASYCFEIIDKPELRKKITEQALTDVKKYTWKKTVKILHDEIYSKLL